MHWILLVCLQNTPTCRKNCLLLNRGRSRKLKRGGGWCAKRIEKYCLTTPLFCETTPILSPTVQASLPNNIVTDLFMLQVNLRPAAWA